MIGCLVLILLEYHYHHRTVQSSLFHVKASFDAPIYLIKK